MSRFCVGLIQMKPIVSLTRWEKETMTNSLHCWRCDMWQDADDLTLDSPCPDCGGILLPYRVADEKRKLEMQSRQALIIMIGAKEDYLGLKRSIVPKRKREPHPLQNN